MSTPSRLRLDPSTNLPSIHSFGELSNFLRGAVADEDSRVVSESMAQLSLHIEAIIAQLRISRMRTNVAPMLVDMLSVLRAHRTLVVKLPLAWRGLYEYAAYLQALNNFRVLIGQWLLDGGPRSVDLLLTAEDFELVAWRTLGEGMLMIDMYDQWRRGEPAETQPPSDLGPLEEPQLERALQWWKKLRL
ncbi:hypothetical protein [Caenimonas koreensis]|uniref:Uncharacterized protein n=1 Tax=Caenimonas koreensis DSM 17982 TaxID=1121255 RepID=A0A844BAQ7_9BURK|nr:hypothetical protein [Caenimonas koreensis]MRD47611.1 hypothetical protein [Caenimonas koreensis DSM 17982]